MIDLAKAKSRIARNPVKLTFNNLKYSVKKKDGSGMFDIVKGVSGYAMPGQTLYIMGASGAGKTSLLNIISKRIGKHSNNTLEGELMINDKLKVNDDNFGKLCGYVMQDDILF